MRERTERHIVQAGHVPHMLKGVPFMAEITGAIRVAWDPEKAPGPHRRLLLSLCQALAPYLRDYPECLALFDEIPEFASEFSKAVLGCGAISSRRSQSRTECKSCGEGISTKDADLRESETIYHSTGNLKVLSEIYCSVDCYEEEGSKIKHEHCEICKKERLLG